PTPAVRLAWTRDRSVLAHGPTVASSLQPRLTRAPQLPCSTSSTVSKSASQVRNVCGPVAVGRKLNQTSSSPSPQGHGSAGSVVAQKLLNGPWTPGRSAIAPVQLSFAGVAGVQVRLSRKLPRALPAPPTRIR